MASTNTQPVEACELLMRDPTEETTLMLHGIACRLTPESVKEILDSLGLRGKFSFVCVPGTASHKSNLSYAFIRFRSPQYAAECVEVCHGRPFGPSAEGKVCQVSLAKDQSDGARLLRRLARKRSGREEAVLLCDDAVDDGYDGGIDAESDADSAGSQPSDLEAVAQAASATCRAPLGPGVAVGTEAPPTHRPPLFLAECSKGGASDLFEDMDLGLEGVAPDV